MSWHGGAGCTPRSASQLPAHHQVCHQSTAHRPPPFCQMQEMCKKCPMKVLAALADPPRLPVGRISPGCALLFGRGLFFLGVLRTEGSFRKSAVTSCQKEGEHKEEAPGALGVTLCVFSTRLSQLMTYRGTPGGSTSHMLWRSAPFGALVKEARFPVLYFSLGASPSAR